MSHKYRDEYVIIILRGCLDDLLNRMDKYIDRRVPDDGPDMEYSKLYDEMKICKQALEDTK
jgi:hypothetical protein